MRVPTSQDIATLGQEFGIKIDKSELEAVQEQVEENIQGLAQVRQLSVLSSESPDIGARSWAEPDTTPYNSIVVRCDVPAKPGTGQKLSDTTIGVKDIIAVAGVPMQCGSSAMEGYIPGQDATVVDRLRGAGGSITAKTNLDEFAGGARGVSHFGQMKNPHDPDHIPGGSSGGSAIAVQTGDVDVALGTDTGGSVRLPASHCGIVGMKPTYGLVPLSGVVENTYTLDHVGPMAETVSMAATVLELIAGKDPTDPASMQAAGKDAYSVGGYTEAVASPPDVSELTLGVILEGVGEGTAEHEVDTEIIARTRAATEQLADAGAEVVEVSIPHYELAGPIKYAQSYTELAAHWRAKGAQYRRGGSVDPQYQASLARNIEASSAEVNPYYRARLITGAHLIKNHQSRHYAHAITAGNELANEFDAASDGVDALVSPTTPSTAPTIDESKTPGYAYARNTNVANITGRPEITLPNGTVSGLPVGIHLLGEEFTDAKRLGISAAVEATL